VYVTEGISFYTGVIGGSFDFGGRTFNAGVRADAAFEETNFLYVPNVKVLDGHLGLSVSVPAAYVIYTAKASGPLNSVTAETEGGGLGDVVLQAQLGWDKSWNGGEFSHSLHLLVVTPTGRYATGFYPFAGLNRPSFDLGWAFTWFDKKSKLQFNGAIGFMASLENDATKYQTGDEFHWEWAVGYRFDNGLILGVVGYDYRQITGDSGRGAILGPFEGTVDAIGPGLSYSSKLGDTPVTISVRDYEQYNAKHMIRGNLALASFTAAFPAAQTLEKPLK
ncbi:MAG TPA: transporter, partial [Hyphomicrobiales bacterium]|nr:transporter [Hyphomicrobiales bacterium]